MPALGATVARDGLAIRDAWDLGRSLHTVLALELLERDVQMYIAEPSDDQLLGLFASPPVLNTNALTGFSGSTSGGGMSSAMVDISVRTPRSLVEEQQTTGATLPSRIPSRRPRWISSSLRVPASRYFSSSESSLSAAASISCPRYSSTSFCKSSGIGTSLPFPSGVVTKAFR